MDVPMKQRKSDEDLAQEVKKMLFVSYASTKIEIIQQL
jgi:hypothetical protein